MSQNHRMLRQERKFKKLEQKKRAKEKKRKKLGWFAQVKSSRPGGISFA